MSEIVFIGIDPGKSGAVAAIYPNQNNRVEIFDTPTMEVKSGKSKKQVYIETEMASILRSLSIGNDIHVFMEKVNAMPGQGVTSMFSFGYGYGLWRGIVAALGMKITLFTPQEWKKFLMSGYGKEKSASVYRAQMLFPNVDLFTPRGKALDGRGDALLIGYYGGLKYGRMAA